MGSRGCKLLRPLFGTVLFVGMIWFLFIGIIASSAAKSAGRVRVPSSASSLVNWHSISHLNYVSKRRVPNGPDPIHNRRTVKTRQPPRRA